VIVVADAGPIIHLSLIGRVDLLPTLYGRVLVPGLVFQEVVLRGKGLPGSVELDRADWTDRVDPDTESHLFDVLQAHLDPAGRGQRLYYWGSQLVTAAELQLGFDLPGLMKVGERWEN
jgi:predicted nucleic acid-binding protein